ncbi:MAG: GNAT family N-acetyltransferase [Caldilineaceae bacterium]|nr:GNAT family N-acetyltransferase [Caldilineaceae bacterium]
MIQGAKVLLRAMTRDDLPRLCQFNNDIAVELAGGGDPPMPQSLARLEAEFDAQVGGGGRDGTGFAIEADGQLIGQCALFNVNAVNRTAELGITIGDKGYWGRGYGSETVTLLIDTVSAITICTGSISPSTVTTTVRLVPTNAVVLWQKDACVRMSGAMAGISICFTWAFCRASGFYAKTRHDWGGIRHLSHATWLKHILSPRPLKIPMPNHSNILTWRHALWPDWEMWRRCLLMV